MGEEQETTDSGDDGVEEENDGVEAEGEGGVEEESDGVEVEGEDDGDIEGTEGNEDAPDEDEDTVG